MYLNKHIKLLTAMKISHLYCVISLSSQEDGGSPGSSWTILSQGFPESACSLVCPDTVCGVVFGYQYFYILQWLLQQTWGHVSRAVTLCEARMKLFGLRVAGQPKNRITGTSIVLCLCQFTISPHLNPSWPGHSRAKDILEGFMEDVSFMVNSIKL